MSQLVDNVISLIFKNQFIHFKILILSKSLPKVWVDIYQPVLPSKFIYIFKKINVSSDEGSEKKVKVNQFKTASNESIEVE